MTTPMHERVFELVSEVIPQVFLVGGSTRDVILCREPKDYDFCTPVQPDEMESLIKAAGKRVYGVGKNFGTLGFTVQPEKGISQLVEVTTFRSEKYEPGNRKPVVAYVDSLQEDLSRRDLTMNAIAFDGSSFIDPFHGEEDINNSIIESVGQPSARFREDPLRMLRVARFVSQLGFEPSARVTDSISDHAPDLYNVSRERWVQEMDKLLMGKNVKTSLNFLYSSAMMAYMFPEFSSGLNTLDFNSDMSLDKKWASLFAPIALNAVARAINHEKAVGICHRLKFSSARTKFILDSLKAGVVQ